MPVSIGIDAGRAYKELGRVEREIRAMVRKAGGNPGPSASRVSRGKRNQTRYTGKVRQAIAKTVEEAIKDVSIDIANASPVYSGWLRANWNHQQGAKPALGVTPTPPQVLEFRRSQGDPDVEPPFLEFFDDIIPRSIDLDGEKAQYIYNTVEYADDVTEGLFPAISAPRDWYITIRQKLSSGKYIRSAIDRAKLEVK